MSAPMQSPSGAGRPRVNSLPRPMSSRPSSTFERQYSAGPNYKKPEYRDYRLPSWIVAELGLRIASIFLVGIVAGCSVRSFLSGFLIWLPLSAVIVAWEGAEFFVFAKNRVHGINPMAHIFVEIIITLGALAYTALSIVEIWLFRRDRYTGIYGGIIEYSVLTGLCAVISVIHTILAVRAFRNLAAKNRGEANYSV